MISQRKIAETLKMPVSTVANILNGTPNYRKETVERVLKAASDLGYQPSRASRSLQRGRSNLIGVAHFGSPYLGANKSLIHSIQAITNYGFEHLVVDLHWHNGNVEAVHNEIIQSRVEGVLLIANHSGLFPKRNLEILRRAGIPVVSLYGEDQMNIPLIEGENERCNFFLTEHLQEVGHRRIVHILPDGRDRSIAARVSGFSKAMERIGPCYLMTAAEFLASWKQLYQKGTPLGVVVKADYPKTQRLMEVNYELGKKLLATGLFPDAIMCANDQAAFGLFNAAYEVGVSIPDQLAITGADNEELGRYPMFGLTTLEADVTQATEAAVDLLIGLVQKKPIPPDRAGNLQFPGKLILRRSCGRQMDFPEKVIQIPDGH